MAEYEIARNTTESITGIRAQQLLPEVMKNGCACALSFIAPGGGGPAPDHTHGHDHLYFVVNGAATIRIDDREYFIPRDQAMLVPGSVRHSVWNRGEEELKMLGVSLHTGSGGR